MQNINSETAEVVFDMIIPRDAFVSKFSMVINGKTYEGKVKTKEKAKGIFTSSTGTAGLVSETQSEFTDGKQVTLRNLNVATTLTQNECGKICPFMV